MDIEADISEDATEDARPVVVVQYRRGWSPSVTVALLILVIAAAIYSHRLRSRNWRGMVDYFRGPPAPVVTADPSPEKAAPTPMVVKVLTGTASASASAEAAPSPTPRLTAPPILEWDPPRPRPPVAIASPPAPPATAAGAPTGSGKAVGVWNTILAESQKQQDAADSLEAAKDDMLERMRDQAEAHRLDEARRVRLERDRERSEFRNDLWRALQGQNGRPGPAIRDLCDRQGVAMGASWRKGIPPGGMVSTVAGRRDRIEQLRQEGQSEAAILDDLICREDRNRVARTGPKTQEEVVIRAARQLLAVPLDTAPRQPRTGGR